MGLDMYLLKAPRIGLSVNDMLLVDIAVGRYIKSEKDLERIDLEYITQVKGANRLKPYIHEEGLYHVYYSVFEEIFYWRKANAIHRWFVNNVQDGVDDCGYYEVTKEQLQTLKDLVDLTLENMFDAPNLLPTMEGFFFGGQEYDEYYINYLKETSGIIRKILKNTDFKKEMIIYTSSW